MKRWKTVMYFSKYENLKYEKIACEMMFLLFKRKDIHMYDSYLKLYINELLLKTRIYTYFHLKY